MENLVFYLVDVFAEEKYAGNQLAVIRNAGLLSATEMQRIANEMHFSETAFLLSDCQRNGGYDVRIFTPSVEVPFAGHPTLGSAYVIKRFVTHKKVRNVMLNLKVGQMVVDFERTRSSQEIAWMKQLAPTFGKTFEISQFARLLQLSEEDFDKKYPVQIVSTGLPFIIVPLKTLNVVKRAKVDANNLLNIAQKFQGGILVFCPQTYHKDNDLNVRVFADLLGIAEDPATGSGNGCLAGYLSHHRYFGTTKLDIRVEQGCEVGRPSLLFLKAESTADQTLVMVGGKVILIAKGTLA
jgi:trans-2,3-dihydro-3-hydroxyanthranilate isomerase